MALSVNNEMPCSTNNSSYLTTSKPSISHPGAGGYYISLLNYIRHYFLNQIINALEF